jgi:hypothetical protein
MVGIPANNRTTEEQLADTKDALDHALTLIESYQMDIRNWIAAGKIPNGFCQGSIYTSAPDMIRRRAAGIKKSF